MTPQVLIPDAATRGIIDTLRSPCAQNSTLKRGYSVHNPRHLGQVHVLPDVTEPVTAPGNGTITRIERHVNTAWDHEAGALDNYQTFVIEIDHGLGVYTAIQGFSTLNVAVGYMVTRGSIVGYALTTEIFFQLLYHGDPIDPATYGSAFKGYDGGKVSGKTRMLRPGPDFIDRPASSVVSYKAGGIRYFVDEFCTKPGLLVNIDFNGSGDRAGYAVTGSTAGDYWNTYAPVAFDVIYGTVCGDIKDAEPYVTVNTVDAGTLHASFVSGSMFETVVSFDAGTEAGTLSMTWLFGSTDTIPEIEYGTLYATWGTGAITETTIVFTGTEYGTNYASWTIGTLFESTVLVNVGTEYGTHYASWTIGTLFDVTVLVNVGTDYGTHYASWTIGTLFDVTVLVNVGTDYGTQHASWESGTIYTLCVPTSQTEAGTMYVSWGTGVIRRA